MKTVLIFSLLIVALHADAGHWQTVDSVYSVVEQMPEYKGGQKALNKHLSETLKLPQLVASGQVRAKVYVRFVVDEQGLAQQFEVMRTTYNPMPGKSLPEQEIETLIPELEREALRAIRSLPPWNPGKHHGRVVKVWEAVPVVFVPKE